MSTDQPAPDQLASFDQTLAALSANVDALIDAYRAEVADGQHPDVSTAGLSEWLLASHDAAVLAEHLAVAVRRLFESHAAPAAAYHDGLDDGRRQTTEGWEREWGVDLHGRGAHCVMDEHAARGIAAECRDYMDHLGPEVLTRLVGPWEPADPAPTAAHPEGGVRAAETALEGAEGGSGDDGSYIRDRYRVPATLNREITFEGRQAQIVGFDGARLRILLDGKVSYAHPTWEIDYLDGHGNRTASAEPARTRVRHDPGALIEEPDEPRTMADCPNCGKPITGFQGEPGMQVAVNGWVEIWSMHQTFLPCGCTRTIDTRPDRPATGTVAPHDQPTTEDGVGWRLARDEEIHRAAQQAAEDPHSPRAKLRSLHTRPRMTDGCGPEHTYRGTCEYAHQAEDGAL